MSDQHKHAHTQEGVIKHVNVCTFIYSIFEEAYLKIGGKLCYPLCFIKKCANGSS